MNNCIYMALSTFSVLGMSLLLLLKTSVTYCTKAAITTQTQEPIVEQSSIDGLIFAQG